VPTPTSVFCRGLNPQPQLSTASVYHSATSTVDGGSGGGGEGNDRDSGGGVGGGSGGGRGGEGGGAGDVPFGPPNEIKIKSTLDNMLLHLI
jgi:hypothetical protein